MTFYELLEKQHFVGLWAESASITAGREPDNGSRMYNLQLAQSKPIAYTTLSLLSVSITAGKFLIIGANISVAKKDYSVVNFKFCNMLFEARTEKASKMTVLFYSELNQRAWLLDRATALVYLMRVAINNRGVNPDAVKQVRYMDGSMTAEDTLIANRNIALYTDVRQTTTTIT